MRSLGQSIAFGFFDHSWQERLQAIQRAGFGEVMLWWGGPYAPRDRPPEVQVEEACRLRLRVRTVHYPFEDTNLLWTEGPEAGEWFDLLMVQIPRVGAAGCEHLVLHCNKGTRPPPPGSLGIDRMRRAAEVALKAGIVLALENTRFLRYNALLYEAVSLPSLGFCFDSGHAFCFTPEEDPLALFGDRLAATHLHDNFGPRGGDLHLLPGYGAIPFDRLLSRLHSYPQVSLLLESCYSPRDARDGLDMDGFLQRSHETMRAYARQLALK